jgi:hypothetical protein
LIKVFRNTGNLMSTTQANIQKKVGVPNVPKLPPLAESIKKINSAKQQLPVQPVQPVQSVQPAPQPAPQTAPAQETVQQAMVPNVASSELEEESPMEEIQEIESVMTETYMSVGSEHGNVEFDLMSHREKGREVRYLNIQIQGYSTNDRGKVNSTYMAITNKEDFERVKSFFSTLKWED